jgi:hypothetical protein
MGLFENVRAKILSAPAVTNQDLVPLLFRSLSLLICKDIGRAQTAFEIA